VKRIVAGCVIAAALAAAPAFAVHPGNKWVNEPGRMGLVFEDVQFPASRDSVSVHGWWFPSTGHGSTVVLAPHGTGTMADLLPFVPEFGRRGYAVLLYDLRDFGPASPGEVDSLRDVVFASRWVDDTEGALRYARSRSVGEAVFGWGQDLGGPLLLAAAGRARGNADALGVEGLFRSAQEQLLWLGLSQDPAVVDHHRALVDGQDDPIGVITRLRTPLFVVIAQKDEVTPPDVTQAMVSRAGGAVETWLLPVAKHDGAERTPGYFDRLTAYFARIAQQRRRMPQRR
jgi:alpha-beta hydrolase superfamily lysophospholipase